MRRRAWMRRAWRGAGGGRRVGGAAGDASSNRSVANLFFSRQLHLLIRAVTDSCAPVRVRIIQMVELDFPLAMTV